jgi:hypothetical protein
LGKKLKQSKSMKNKNQKQAFDAFKINLATFYVRIMTRSWYKKETRQKKMKMNLQKTLNPIKI